MIKIHHETFAATTKGDALFVTGTIEVTINGDRRRVGATRCPESTHQGRIDVRGLAVRFSQGAKVWPASGCYWPKTDNFNNLTPNIDRRGQFVLVGFAEDFVGKPVRSQHNAVR